MTTHRLKTDPGPFKAVLEGVKKCELRFNDRGFQVGDTLLLEETKRSEADRKKSETNTDGVLWTKVEHELTGRVINALVTHILDDGNHWGGVEKGWVVMSIAGAFLIEEDIKEDPMDNLRNGIDAVVNATGVTPNTFLFSSEAALIATMGKDDRPGMYTIENGFFVYQAGSLEKYEGGQKWKDFCYTCCTLSLLSGSRLSARHFCSSCPVLSRRFRCSCFG